MAKAICNACGRKTKEIIPFGDNLFVCGFCRKKLQEFDAMENAKDYKRFQREYDFFRNLRDPNMNFIGFLTNRYSAFLQEIRESGIAGEPKDELPQPETYTAGFFRNTTGDPSVPVYAVDGARGRHIDVYPDKAVFSTKVTIGSLITHSAANGEKTIYYTDCIGIQFKPSRLTLGYLQLETAAESGGRLADSFFHENSFTFDDKFTKNVQMEEVANYIKQRISEIKSADIKITEKKTEEKSTGSVADELLKFKQLLDMGVITQEEFDQQKEKLLSR